MESDLALKACPFCGAGEGRLLRAFTRATDDFAFWSVECRDCGVEVADDASQEAADAAWNTRTPPSEADKGAEYRRGIEDAARVADGSYAADKAKEAEYLASAKAADSTSGREVDLEYAVSYARRASGDKYIATAIRALATKEPDHA